MLYPTVSNMVNERNQSKVITRYEEKIDLLSQQEREKALQEAYEYNERFPSVLARESAESIASSAEYNNTLNLAGNGIMGTIIIDKLRVNLPIYHGTSSSVLQVAVGHLPQSSLPVGGSSTHAVLSTHSGLPSATLFTDLEKLEKGDIFCIEVLDEQLVYQVDQMVVVEPDDSKELQIVDGKDYVTLVTCTPYGVNSHRLLVRGERIFVTDDIKEQLFVANDAVFLDKLIIIPIVIVPVLIGGLFWALMKPAKKKK